MADTQTTEAAAEDTFPGERAAAAIEGAQELFIFLQTEVWRSEEVEHLADKVSRAGDVAVRQVMHWLVDRDCLYGAELRDECADLIGIVVPWTEQQREELGDTYGWVSLRAADGRVEVRPVSEIPSDHFFALPGSSAYGDLALAELARDRFPPEQKEN